MRTVSALSCDFTIRPLSRSNARCERSTQGRSLSSRNTRPETTKAPSTCKSGSRPRSAYEWLATVLSRMWQKPFRTTFAGSLRVKRGLRARKSSSVLPTKGSWFDRNARFLGDHNALSWDDSPVPKDSIKEIIRARNFIWHDLSIDSAWPRQTEKDVPNTLRRVRHLLLEMNHMYLYSSPRRSSSSAKTEGRSQ